MGKIKRFLEALATLWEYSPAKRNQVCIKRRRETLVEEGNKPTKKLLELLTCLGIPHEGNLASIVTSTQQMWLRPDGTERWEIETVMHDSKPKLLKYFAQLGLQKDISPLANSYQYCILLGASLETIKNRIHYLSTLVNKGLSFEQLVILTSSRKLDPKLEAIEAILDTVNSSLSIKPSWTYSGQVPKTETEMIELILSQSLLPQYLEEVPLLIVDTPIKNLDDAVRTRPTTKDTVKYWLQSKPKAGKCLVISSQPFIHYHDLVLRNTLPCAFTIETVGPKALEEYTCELYLDTLARALYEENRAHSIGKH